MPYSKKHLSYSSKRKKIKNGSSQSARKTDGEQYRRKRNGKPSLLPGSWSLLPPKVESKPVPVKRTWSMYNIGEIVWAKAPQLPWWPAEVIKVEGEELVNSKNEKECMVVELFNETKLVRITNPEMVKKYDCPEREHIVTEGMGHEFFMFAVSCAGSGSTPTKMKLSQSNNGSPEKNDKEQQINNELTEDCRNGDLMDSDSKDIDTNPSKVEYHSTSQCATSQSEQNKIDAQLSSGEIETNTQEMKLNKRKRSSRKKILFQEESKADMPQEDVIVCGKYVNQTRKRKGSVDIAPSQTRKKTRLKRIHSDSSLNVQQSSTSTVETAQAEQDTPDLETTICEDQTSSLQKDNSVLELPISKHDMSSTSILSSVAGEGNVKMRGVRGRKRGPKGKQNKSAKFIKKNAMNTGNHISSVQSFEEESENSNDGLLKIHYTPKHRRKANQMPAEKSKLKDIATKSKIKKRGRPKRKVSPKNNSQDSGASQEAHYRDGSSPVPLDLKDINHNFPTCTDDGLIDGRSKLPTEYDYNKNSFMTESKYCASFDPNLCKDMCDSSESDEELPEGLTPIAQEPLAIDDIVWVKWTRCPHWPAVIKQIYRRRKRILKVSVLPIEPISYFPPKFTVRYYPGRVLPFLHPDKEKYMKLGETHEDIEIRKKFMRACETVINYFSKKALGNLQPEDTEFFNNIDKNSYQEDSEGVSEEGYLDDIQRIAEDNDDTAKSEEQDEDLDDVLFIKSENIENQDKKVIERYNKIRMKNMKLVDFCVSAVMKEYLLGIIHGKKTSNRHYIYHHGTSIERNKLKNSGFGPIADDEQQELIVQEMIAWYSEAKNLGEKELPDIGYILDVWVPEAVILGLIKTKGYNRSRAMVIFEKGVSMTKTEKASLHVSMLNSLKNISEEERTLYKEKADDRMRAILYQHGIEYDPSMFANS